MIRYLFLLFISTLSLFGWKMEAGKITVNSTFGTTAMTHIDFKQTYSSPPLVFTLPNSWGPNPSTLRVVNVTTTGFDIYPIEPQGEDGPHIQMVDVPYIAIEEGEHTLPNGTRIVAKSINISNYQGKFVWGTSWHNESLSGFSSTPVILAAIQTRNNERSDKSVPNNPSKPWITAVVDDVSSSGFKIALDRSETYDGAITTTEKVAYLAIEANVNGDKYYFGSNSKEKIEFETILTDNIVIGWDDGRTRINFSKSYEDAVAVAFKNSRNESDGGWFRSGSIGNNYISLRVDEDRAVDKERTHKFLKEKAGIVVFSKPFDAEFIENSNPATLIINEVMYNETKRGSDNDEFIELYVKEKGNLEGFIISDQDCNYYQFPNCEVEKGDYVIFHIGEGTNSCTGAVKHFYKGSSPYLNNDKDDILLIAPALDVVTTTNTSSCGTRTFNGEPMDYMAYGRLGGNVDEIPTSLKGVTLSWDYDKAQELEDGEDGVSVALTPNATDSNRAACWEFSASGNGADNGCENYLPTRDTNPEPSQTNSIGLSNTAAAKMSITKSSIIISDPVNNTTNPKRIPGAIIRYCFVVDNSGEGDAQNVRIKDTLKSDNKDKLIYKKSGSIIQDISKECECAKIDTTNGSFSNDEVEIELGELKGTSNPSESRACAYIEVEIE